MKKAGVRAAPAVYFLGPLCEGDSPQCGEMSRQRQRGPGPKGSRRSGWGRELHLYPKLNHYSAVFVSAINSPGIRQSDDSPTMMNTVRDSQLMLPPSSHPTALNPQMP